MRVYLDHNSTTPLRLEVRERWLEVVAEGLGNPSSLHASGRRARALLDEARERVAAALGVHEDEEDRPRRRLRDPEGARAPHEEGDE